MSISYSVTGTYGTGTKATIHCFEQHGTTWYAVDGSTNVNATEERVEEGTNVEALTDYDHFTASDPIHDPDDIKTTLEE